MKIVSNTKYSYKGWGVSLHSEGNGIKVYMSGKSKFVIITDMEDNILLELEYNKFAESREGCYITANRIDDEGIKRGHFVEEQK